MKKAKCTLCNEMYAMLCPCGAQRCKACVGAAAPRKYNWDTVHIDADPFYVVDLAKLDDKVKKQWIVDELGDRAKSLMLFASKFADLFGHLYSRAYDKKYACLKLFGDVTFKDLSIEEKEEFEQTL